LQEGVSLPSAESRREIEDLRVSDIMQPGAEPLPATMDVGTAGQRLQEMARNAWPVGQRDRLQGIVTVRQLNEAQVPDAFLRDVVRTGDEYIFVYEDHPISYALNRMGSAGLDAIPVVSRANIRQLQGVITMPAILAAYGVTHERSAAG